VLLKPSQAFSSLITPYAAHSPEAPPLAVSQEEGGEVKEGRCVYVCMHATKMSPSPLALFRCREISLSRGVLPFGSRSPPPTPHIVSSFIMPLQKQGAAAQSISSVLKSLWASLILHPFLPFLEAYKALKMLVALRGQLPTDEREDADRLVEVMSSRLFGALLGMGYLCSSSLFAISPPLSSEIGRNAEKH
jgi:hypothetical protein